MTLSLESILTRELDLRFIDARTIATEARLSLGIQGYPTQDQISDIRDEAIRIYRSKPMQEQRTLQEMNMELETIKTPAMRSLSVASTSSNSDLLSITSEMEGSSSRRRSSGGLMGIFRR